ncbi:MAG: UbiD family decarboxylase, partial [Proteobacteria bacterium]|nr:UbiD family decarboxylase [Pseudomonadota bacterium]
MAKAAKLKPSRTKFDFEKFRLRTFVDKLIDMDEVDIHDEPVDLADVSEIAEATDKAVLYRDAGPEHSELVSSVAGGRRRLAAAFGVEPSQVTDAYWARVANRQPVAEVPSKDAPVHEVVMTGDDVDLSVLPFHPHHEFDGGTYLTSGIDYALDPETGMTNVGCRRLSLRSKNTLAFNLTAPSDLRRIYLKSVERGERLQVSFAVGSHPLDFMAASGRIPADEITLIGTLRGEPVPLVRCLTNDLRVPADVEMVLEGYFDEHGYREPEGPYGEYMGLYGPMHMDPVFHVTAVTQRKDVLHQTLLHGSGGILDRTDSG